MTQSKKDALLTLGIWGLVLVLLFTIFFLGDGPQHYHEDSLRKLLSAIAVGLGMVSYFLLLRKTKRRKNNALIAEDERDFQISQKANVSALTAVSVFVFIFCMSLYVGYENVGEVPVGWLWFMGYGTGCFGLIAQSLATLIYYRELS